MDFDIMLDYQIWTSDRIIKILRNFSEEEMNKDLAKLFVNDRNPNHGSIRSIIEHLLISLNFCLKYSKIVKIFPEAYFSALAEQFENCSSQNLLDK